MLAAGRINRILDHIWVGPADIEAPLSSRCPPPSRHSTMSIQDLPEELCDMTCDSLNERNLKALGRTCRQWRTPAAKSLFRCVSVEFKPGGCAAIANISKAKHLATAVRVVELRRTEFLPRFYKSLFLGGERRISPSVPLALPGPFRS